MKPYFTNSLEKVFKDGPSIGNNISSGSTFKNERKNIQVVIPPLADSNLDEYTLAYSIETELMKSVQLYKIDFVPVGNISANLEDEDIIKNTSMIYPDVLIPIENVGELLLKYNEWTSLWMEIDLDKLELFDVYNSIQFNYSSSKMTGSIRYNLDIINVPLPEQQTVHTEWFHTDSLCTYYGVEPFSEEYWTTVEKYIVLAYHHSQNTILTPIFTPPIDTEENKERLTIQLVGISKKNNRYEFDFTKLTRWSEMLKKIGIKYIEFPPFFTQWGAKFTPKIIANEDGVGKNLFGWHVSYESPEYKYFLECFLPELNIWIQENDWDEKAFIHVSDEPNEDSIGNYKYGKSILNKHLEKVVFIDAVSEYAYYKNGLVDIPVAGTPSINNFFGENVNKLWCYYCGIHNDKVSNRYIAQKSRRTRIIGFQMYKYGVSGFLHWGYNFWFTELSQKHINPYEISDAGGAFPSGDAFIVYPGENFEPIPSLRLKLIYESFQDIRACELLEKLTDKKTVDKIIDKYIPKLSFYTNGEPLQNIELIREEINESIKKLVLIK